MDLPPLYKRVIGLDVHHEQVTACAIFSDKGSKTEAGFQVFGTFHNDCQALAHWAKGFKADLVIMESTGVYWEAVNLGLATAGPEDRGSQRSSFAAGARS